MRAFSTRVCGQQLTSGNVICISSIRGGTEPCCGELCRRENVLRDRRVCTMCLAAT